MRSVRESGVMEGKIGWGRGGVEVCKSGGV